MFGHEEPVSETGGFPHGSGFWTFLGIPQGTILTRWASDVILRQIVVRGGR